MLGANKEANCLQDAVVADLIPHIQEAVEEKLKEIYPYECEVKIRTQLGDCRLIYFSVCVPRSKSEEVADRLKEEEKLSFDPADASSYVSTLSGFAFGPSSCQAITSSLTT